MAGGTGKKPWKFTERITNRPLKNLMIYRFMNIYIWIIMCYLFELVPSIYSEIFTYFGSPGNRTLGGRRSRRQRCHCAMGACDRAGELKAYILAVTSRVGFRGLFLTFSPNIPRSLPETWIPRKFRVFSGRFPTFSPKILKLSGFVPHFLPDFSPFAPRKVISPKIQRGFPGSTISDAVFNFRLPTGYLLR